MQLVDRSLLNSKFTLDRDIGLQLHGKYKWGKALFRPILALSMGEGKTIVIGNTGGYQYTGKLEFLPFGAFASKGDYFMADIKREPQPKLAIAVAYDFNDESSRQQGNLKKFLTDSTGTLITADISTFFADLMFKYRGFSTMIEYANRSVSRDNLGFHSGSGYNIAMGYLFKNNLELALRYTNIAPDLNKAFQSVDEYTVGLSKYIVGHNLKVQTDFSWIMEEDEEDPSIRYRFQFEFAF